LAAFQQRQQPGADTFAGRAQPDRNCLRLSDFRQRSDVPTRKEIQWSELKVGALVMVAMAVLIGLIFLMSGSTGGLFAKRLRLRSYFANAAGLKDGAPVTLEGVTIGNVHRIRVVPSRNPRPVEVEMEIGAESLVGLHADSTAAIAQAGVLGDSYVDIDSTHAQGPPPVNNAELRAAGSPTIQDVIESSQDSIQQIQATLVKLDTTLDTINSDRGTVGQLLNDRKLANHIQAITANLETVSAALAQNKGTAGRLINDDTLITHLDSAVDKLDQITTALNQGQGTMGKLLHDDTLYNNLNATVKNTNDLVTQINSGQGALGKFVKDPAFAQKLDDTVTHLDAVLKGINEGTGTVGQLFRNRELYDNLNQTLTSTHDLIKAFRENPKKYLSVQLKIF
jgi:phospholipid/cholesterol/gamma-HCH transport system substrate-binding protein